VKWLNLQSEFAMTLDIIVDMPLTFSFSLRLGEVIRTFIVR